MLNIRRQFKNEYEADVFINEKLYVYVGTYGSPDYFICHKLADFLFLSQHSFTELIQNAVGSINYNHRDKENTSYYFSYSINTTYQDPGYLEYLEMNEQMGDVNPNYIYKGNYISASLSFKYGEWKKLYSFNEFQLFVHDLVLLNDYLISNSIIYISNQGPYDDFESLTIEFRDIPETECAHKYIERLMPILKEVLTRAAKELDNQHSLDIYSTYFNFPEEYKIACKQYLMYFAQFLLDLGISVKTELKDTKAGTFFSVIPDDKNQAIVDIKELLVEYLNAPQVIIDEDSILSNNPSELAVIQFQANLYHLKSQLAFANSQIELKQAIIETKNASIQALNLINYQLSEKIERSSKNDEESLIDGIVSVTQIEKPGFKIHLPEILRRLKRKF